MMFNGSLRILKRLTRLWINYNCSQGEVDEFSSYQRHEAVLSTSLDVL